jgi:hypothetical protein
MYQNNFILITTSVRNKYLKTILQTIQDLKDVEKALYINAHGTQPIRPKKNMDMIVYDDTYNQEAVQLEMFEEMKSGEYEVVILHASLEDYPLDETANIESLVKIYMCENFDSIENLDKYVHFDLDAVLATPLLKRKKAIKVYEEKYKDVDFIQKYHLFD